ncbi:unnamed protein product [Nezara viridula]|uniref:Uncharacterized protein n=1 Tax=Nezara viridula TaxID=85310 RepID=A0A9P0HI57_NEZVI|nr:unnamed protein product [Nezara viridula]
MPTAQFSAGYPLDRKVSPRVLPSIFLHDLLLRRSSHVAARVLGYPPRGSQATVYNGFSDQKKVKPSLKLSVCLETSPSELTDPEIDSDLPIRGESYWLYKRSFNKIE